MLRLVIFRMYTILAVCISRILGLYGIGAPWLGCTYSTIISTKLLSLEMQLVTLIPYGSWSGMNVI